MRAIEKERKEERSKGRGANLRRGAAASPHQRGINLPMMRHGDCEEPDSPLPTERVPLRVGEAPYVPLDGSSAAGWSYRFKVAAGLLAGGGLFAAGALSGASVALQTEVGSFLTHTQT